MSIGDIFPNASKDFLALNAPEQETADPFQDSAEIAWYALEQVNLNGTMPEYRFALNYLEERVRSRESICWAHEPFEIRMVGQTYTPDFLEITADGIFIFYEVKGSQKLGSQDRASVKFRFTSAFFENERVKMLWAKEKKEGSFTIKKLPMQGKLREHKALRKTK